MKNYRLSDIWWVYSKDGMIVMPYIYNNCETKIQELCTNFIYELPNNGKPLSDKAKEVFAEVFNVETCNLCTDTFYNLQKNDILKLKGFNALKYRSVKESISGVGGTKNIPYRATLTSVNANDIETFTRLIHKGLNSNKKINKADLAHNQTTNF